MKPVLPRHFLLRLLLVWLLLLAVSLGFRWLRGFEARSLKPGTYVGLPAEAGGKGGSLAWREMGGGAAGGGLPVILLHGNPVAGGSLVPLARVLADGRRVLVPDLPGFGRSRADLENHGAHAQAPVLRAWLTERGIARAHWVGYSQGSISALEVAEQFPDSVASVTLLAGVGLQEYELFGDYRLNQPVYALEFAALWALRWLTPHFGLLDRPWLAPRTALNFMDTDLRASRRLLESISAPVLILHAVDDRLVPFAAARAHAELVPQAVFRVIPGGHMAPIRRAPTVAGELRPFFSAVEAGQALDRQRALREDAAPKPALEVAADPRATLFQNLFFGALLFFLVFLSEDLSCIAGGLLAAKGVITFFTAAGACFLGIWISDVVIYLVGYILGPGVFQSGRLRRSFEGGRISEFARAYEKNGAKIVFLTRFIPGSRVAAYLTAGVLRVGLLRFAFWLGVAALLWTPLLVGAAYLVGNPLIAWWERAGWIVLPLIAASLILTYLALRMVVQCFSWRGRRLLRGRWLRWTRWEFWPRPPVYLPVLLYGARLALRHRSTTVWAAANPGIQPASGFVMESKSAILEGLSGRPDHVACWRRIEPDDDPASRLDVLEDFQASLPGAWPVVLKPDVGQRGEGVAVLGSRAEAERYLRLNPAPVIAQEFIPGREFGVFYYRYPGETEGRIFSITEKVLPTVCGDGRRTLEGLILDDPRAVALAAHYLKVNRDRLASVPADGEQVRLVDLGTHCRGAVFLDGNRWQSEALRRALDEVVADFDGFHFGRFDLRVPSGEDLTRGENFRILELNGVSSEATDIYDPGHGLLHAWRVLFRQWRLAFEIGARNRDRGAPVPGMTEIFRLLQCHRRRTVFDVEESVVTAPLGEDA